MKMRIRRQPNAGLRAGSAKNVREESKNPIVTTETEMIVMTVIIKTIKVIKAIKVTGTTAIKPASRVNSGIITARTVIIKKTVEMERIA